MRKLFFLLIIFLFSRIPAWPEEGMWIPLLLGELNIENMQELGLQLDAEDIYSINHSSLTDAVVKFGFGCTGELISSEGLILTNHHCGLSQIQSHSSLEQDFLTEGFWAANREEELTNPGLTVSFLRQIEDVTVAVLDRTDPNDDLADRETVIGENISRLTAEATMGNNYSAEIKPIFFGNQYFLFVYEIFTDIRLVAAPPLSIGKFGSETDNWMWPRYTGDFALFRIYADENNNPADYSPKNRAYRSDDHFRISLDGVKENDFTMVLGYPGYTYLYTNSSELEVLSRLSLPEKIGIRKERMEVMQDFMNRDELVRIKYASKYASLINDWKKWIGMLNGLEKSDVIARKTLQEDDFGEWLKEKEERKKQYGGVLPGIDSLVGEYRKIILADDYFTEIVLAIELISFANIMDDLIFAYKDRSEDPGLYEKNLNRIKEEVNLFYRDYHMPLDKKTSAGLFRKYYLDLDPAYHPAAFRKIKNTDLNHFIAFSDQLYSRSFFTQQEQVEQLIGNLDERAIEKIIRDPVYDLFDQFRDAYSKVYFERIEINKQKDELYRLYVRGLTEMYPDKVFSPDANFTMRAAYGRVQGYRPMDAVEYRYYTSLKGMIEKEDPGIYDYQVPEKLKELYLSQDFGPYGVNGTMPVCFIATNHTSGGNSGSPVLNARGELIGLNFDRNWEGTMSDYYYDASQCRNIALDIRYVLFIIDRFAGADYLLQEIELDWKK